MRHGLWIVGSVFWATLVHAMPSAPWPDFVPPPTPTPGGISPAVNYGTINFGVESPAHWPEITTANWGLMLGETYTATNGTVLVTGVNNLDFADVTQATAWWAESLDGTATVGPVSYLVGPYQFGSDPTVLYWPLDRKFHRFEVSFDEDGPAGHSAVVTTH